jgi:hypothetical protein
VETPSDATHDALHRPAGKEAVGMLWMAFWALADLLEWMR